MELAKRIRYHDQGKLIMIHDGAHHPKVPSSSPSSSSFFSSSSSSSSSSGFPKAGATLPNEHGSVTPHTKQLRPAYVGMSPDDQDDKAAVLPAPRPATAASAGEVSWLSRDVDASASRGVAEGLPTASAVPTSDHAASSMAVTENDLPIAGGDGPAKRQRRAEVPVSAFYSRGKPAP